MLSPILLETNLPGIELRSRGKVRDIYNLGDILLFVATDRISAFDCILPTGIPDKGRVLTQLSLFWFDFLKDIVPNHLISADISEYPARLKPYRDQLEGRSMLVRRAQMFQAECVARGYLAGSGWKDYQATGAICGVVLPPGLLESSKLPEPIFTPATKAASGHDENIPFERFVEITGDVWAHQLRNLTLRIYRKAAEYAESRGILLADTKFEFGLIDGKITLADEVLTPDSSRFWPRESYSPGRPQPSYDKQFVRDYLEKLDWDKRPPAPPLPPDIVERTSEKYKQAYWALTGRQIK
ncbi:MAG: phosphoribosylaminoimidazolesuccinocarboxamide synthase [Bryobacteraceae bacterium]|nr:phosphoribosylaminoimidazolesuccinocarboxamide synthase [Bryobacteraceae bacterium]MDW8376720.1 phosphoribosylaminoimidazolesuccinocarboxamide synthase [Bryobacterales bacterium]